MPGLLWLDKADIRFPDISRTLAAPAGLLAAGGDLRPERLLEAYRQGIFPWYEEGQPILWWSPDPRTLLFTERLHISRSLRKLMRRESFEVKTDTAFGEVLDGCAQLGPKRPGTWITPAMKAAYLRMFELGWAHSVEVWQEEELVGGLYGLAIGHMFFGESMFSRRPSASKIALVNLCAILEPLGVNVIDCQVGNDYLHSMGAEDVPREAFRHLLQQHCQTPCDAPPPWPAPGVHAITS